MSSHPTLIPDGHAGYDLQFTAVRRMKISCTAKVIFAYVRSSVARKNFHPALRVIVKECAVARSSATRAVAELEEAGLLRVEGGHGKRPRYSFPPVLGVELTGPESMPVEDGSTGLESMPVGSPTGPESMPVEDGSTGLELMPVLDSNRCQYWTRFDASTGLESMPHTEISEISTERESDPAAAARAPASAPTREASPAAAAVSERTPRSGSSLVKLFEDACDRATGTRPDLTGRPTLRAAQLVKAHPWDKLEHSVAAFARHLAALSPEDRAGIRSYFAVWASDVARWPERVAHNGPAPGRRSKHIKPSERYARPVAEIEAAARAPTADVVAELRSGRKRAEA